MANDSSFLFSGISFNRKKFGADIARFQKKDSDTDSARIWSVAKVESAKTREAVEEKTASTKKRKRKGNTSGIHILLLCFRKCKKENVEGFNVFRNSASVAQSSGEVQANEESIELNKKEQNRLLEWDAIFRKQHNIHVSGYNIPSPLQSFDELKSRYNCSSYLLRNLKELGFREPTSIQRQAIPVLLDGRECFACAPTGSGKTLLSTPDFVRANKYILD